MKMSGKMHPKHAKLYVCRTIPQSWQYTFKTLCDVADRIINSVVRATPELLPEIHEGLPNLAALCRWRQCTSVRGLYDRVTSTGYRRKVRVLWNMESKNFFFTELYAGFPTFSFQGKQQRTRQSNGYVFVPPRWGNNIEKIGEKFD
jgi:hypothetical protein